MKRQTGGVQPDFLALSLNLLCVHNLGFSNKKAVTPSCSTRKDNVPTVLSCSPGRAYAIC